MQHQAEGIVDGSNTQIVLPIRSELDGEHTPQHRDGTTKVGLSAQKLREQVEGLKQVRGIGAEIRFLNREHALEDRNGRRRVALIHLYPSQPSQIDAYLDCIG